LRWRSDLSANLQVRQFTSATKTHARLVDDASRHMLANNDFGWRSRSLTIQERHLR
jgi:hypothetical protein